MKVTKRRSRWMVGVMLLFVGAFCNGASAQQNVFVDFASFETRLNQATAAAGVANFSTAERMTIQANVAGYIQTAFAGYSITFSTTNPGGIFSTIDFDQVAGAGSYGLADGIDFRNVVKNDVANVFTGNFGDFVHAADPRATQIMTISNSLGGTASHELGHNLGLEHRDCYGLIAMPPSNSTGGGFSGGIQNQTMMATGITGLTTAQRESVRRFSDLDHAKLEYGDGVVASTLPLIMEQGPAHGTAGSAQQINLSTRNVSAGEYDEAGLIRGVIGMSLQLDFYSIDMQAGQFLTVEVMSDVSFADSVDSLIAMIDTDGITELATNDDTSVDEDSVNPGGFLYGLDSSIFNFQANATGKYFLRMGTFGMLDTGNYYVVLASGQPIPEPTHLGILVAMGLIGYGWRRRQRASLARVD